MRTHLFVLLIYCLKMYISEWTLSICHYFFFILILKLLNMILFQANMDNGIIFMEREPVGLALSVTLMHMMLVTRG